MHPSKLIAAIIGGAMSIICVRAQATPTLLDELIPTLSVVTSIGLKCGLVNGKLVCGDKGGSNQKSDDADDDHPKKKKKKNKNSERACPPGYVVLEEKNKYDAFCEPKEGLPPPKPSEAEKCKFPGEVGTPPNCSCPTGTEFMGYKGCLPKKADPVGPSPKKVVNECYTFPFVKGEQAHQAPFVDKCRDVYKGTIQCDGTFESGKVKCCCTYSQ